MLGPNAIDQTFFLPSYPFWSLMIIAADIVALWGLCSKELHDNADRRPSAAALQDAGDAGHGDRVEGHPAGRVGLLAHGLACEGTSKILVASPAAR